MNAEVIAAQLLNAPGIVALVGTKRALSRLPTNTKPPALVYQVVDAIPMPNVSTAGPQLARARLQINPLGTSVAQIKSIHAAVREALDFIHQVTVSGNLVVSCRLELFGPVDKDDESNIWTQSADYILHYYE